MNKKLLVGILTGLFFVGMAGMANATILFTDDFEGGLGAWTGKTSTGGVHNGQIVVDPADSGNGVLNFTALNYQGDIFTSTKSLFSITNMYTLSFDYLGLDNTGLGTPGDLGGTIGYSYGLPAPGTEVWLAGTGIGGGIPHPPLLVDDGAWHHYSISFVSTLNASIHLMVEDWGGSGGIAGDAYFDNIVLTDAVPEPTTIALLGIGIVGLAGTEVRRRRKKKAVDKS